MGRDKENIQDSCNQDTNHQRLLDIATSKNTAFLVGNGVNRFGSTGNRNSWEDLLLKLLDSINQNPGEDKKFHNMFQTIIKKSSGGHTLDVSYPELYDILAIRIDPNDFEGGKKIIKEIMGKWKASEAHTNIVEFCIQHKIPILTVNFDKNLENSHPDKIKQQTKAKPGRHRYPFNVYYSHNAVTDPLADFAIWHIHGVIEYFQSIRIGATDYAQMLAYIRRSEKDCYMLNNQQGKSGRTQTWLDVFFNSNLVIFGLGLGVQEMVVRYLLIQRRRCPNNGLKTYFITEKKTAEYNHFFLECFGVEIVEVNNWSEWYSIFDNKGDMNGR
jgi:hypothetical protein